MSTTTATTTRGPGSASRVDLSLGCGEALRVHRFAVREELSAPFGVRVLARSPDPTLALGSVLGQPTALRIAHAERSWSGICHRVRLVQSVELGAAEAGLSTYEIEIVPRLWLLGERTRYRIFQHLAIPDVVRAVLGEWDIEAESRIDAAQHPRLVYKVQYGESDLSFVSRLLEEAGIAYGVEDDGGETSRLVLSDAIHRSAPRRAHALVHVESPNERVQRDFATCVSIDGRVRPEAVSFRDHDFRRPAWSLLGASRAPTEERAALERWLYRPGAFLVEGAAARAELHDDRYGAQLAARALEAERADCCVVSFKTSAADLRPGTIVTVEGHPRPELDPRVGLLVTSIAIDGAPQGDWTVRVTAVPASTPWRPARRTPKPTVHGVETGTVIGPAGEEIHTDEHGRVRVQFPWDREAQGSCWLRVAQGWAGAGLGLFALPRVGQEVMVGFLSGDPDQPIVVGRVSNALNPAPLKLPAERSQSVWRSGTTPGGEGWSEIRIEDMKGAELLSIRAERDMAIVARRHRGKVIGGDESARTEGQVVAYVGRDEHLTVEGEQRERIRAKRSITVEGDQHHRVAGDAALEAGGEIHIRAGAALVLEGADVTLRGPGGFVRIDGGGVAIDGGSVRIKEGGAPGTGHGSSPALPIVPLRADDERARRRLPLFGIPPEVGPPIPAGPRVVGEAPTTPEEQTICGLICLCNANASPHRRPSDCLTARIRALDAASGSTSRLKAEVPYDMSKDPPAPVMSRNEPERPSGRKHPRGCRVPDVVIVKDPSKPPTQDNIERVVEVKFPGDNYRGGQNEDYERIAGSEEKMKTLTPESCGCVGPEPKPLRREVTAEEVAEVALLALLVVALILDDALPGGQLDDAAIPPALARILSRLAPLLRGLAPVLP